jgi:50S ribosomal subunit-associated GTPase HflX
MEILRKEPNSYAFSVRTGFGIEGLLNAIESSLPRPSVEINVVIPYNRGDLVHGYPRAREMYTEEYVAEGTSIHARVDEDWRKDRKISAVMRGMIVRHAACCMRWKMRKCAMMRPQAVIKTAVVER